MLPSCCSLRILYLYRRILWAGHKRSLAKIISPDRGLEIRNAKPKAPVAWFLSVRFRRTEAIPHSRFWSNPSPRN